MIIRPECSADHRSIRRVVAAAFGSDAEADLVDRIRSSPEYVAEMALVAVDDSRRDDAIVGHVMISGAVLRSDGGERPIVMLSPLAVDPDVQGTGIGGALVRAATALADERGEPLVVLEGSPRYYLRFGFEPALPLGIRIPLPDWAPPAAGQVLRLGAYDPSDPSLGGDVVYPAAFDDL